MAINKARQRKGYGKKFMRLLEQEARRIRRTYLLLFTTDSLKFYEKWGFKQGGRINSFTTKRKTRYYLIKKL
jgi:N-acetylglutamate synthase-like GNAT family acetyltransferase